MACLARFLGCERGSATIEFVIWVPWFMALLIIATDVSFIYLSESKMQNTSRDAARRLSTGQIAGGDLQALADAQLGPGYAVTDCSDADAACVRITRPMSEVAVFGGFLGELISGHLAAQTTMRKEPGV